MPRPDTQRSCLPELCFVLGVLGAQRVRRAETVGHRPGGAGGLEVGLDAVVDDAVVVTDLLCVVTRQPALVRPAGSQQ